MSQYKSFGRQEENVYDYEKMQEMYFERDISSAALKNKQEEDARLRKKIEDGRKTISDTRKKAIALAVAVLIAGGSYTAIATNNDLINDTNSYESGEDITENEDYNYQLFMNYRDYVYDKSDIMLPVSDFGKCMDSGELRSFVESGEYDNYMTEHGARKL